MAKITKRTIKWNPSVASDVIGYRIYFEQDPAAVSYTSPFKQVTVTQVVLPDDIPELANVDAVLNIGISAIDDAQNESDLSLVSFPFDQVPPDQPTGLEVL